MENIVTLPIGELKAAIRSHAAMNVPLIIVGPPGCGKTQIMAQAADEDGALYTELLIAGRDIGDWYMPFVDNGGLKFHYNEAIPLVGSKWDTDKLVYLNIDEFSGGKPLMQNQLLKALDEFMIGADRLSPNTRIFGTGNRAWDLAHVEQLSAALGNRATFITVEPDLDAFLAHGIRRNFHPITLAWVKFDPTYLMSFDAEQFLAGDPAFCSPRSNERLSKIQSEFDKGTMSMRVFTALVCGTIGQKVGIKYIGFTKIREEMPDIPSILAGNFASAKIPKSPEVLYAVIFSITQRTEKVTLPNALGYIERLNPEWQSMFSNALSTAKPNLVATAAWGTFASKIANL